MPDNILNLLSEDAFNEKMDTQNALLAAIASNNGGIVVKSWKDIQAIVRLGLASKVFHIGDQLVCNKGDKQLVWDIIGFDHDVPADAQFKHSMTIQLHDLLPSAMQFDGSELLFYVNPDVYPDGLAAGTYNVILNHGAYYNGTAEDGTYQFTCTSPIPSGGGIKHSSMGSWRNAYGQSYVLAGTFTTYDAEGNEIEKGLATTLGSGGTNLGTFSGSDPSYMSDTSCCNFTERNLGGSNRWKTSALRQFLNSDKAAGSVWQKQHIFDRPPTWNVNTAGFLSDIDADFVEVIGEVTKRTALSIADGKGYEDLTERFFLIARGEAYAGNENSIDEGTPYEYYSLGSDLSAAGTGDDSNRIKYRGGSANYWWLRSPISGYGSHVRIFAPSGILHYDYAGDSIGVAPACNII